MRLTLSPSATSVAAGAARRYHRVLIAFGSAALLLAGGYAGQSAARAKARADGHLQIGGRGFGNPEGAPLSSGLDDVEGLRRSVMTDPRVRAAAARLEFTGLASTGNQSVAVLGRGVEPREEYERAGFEPRLVAGRRVAPAATHEAMAAAGLARNLNLAGRSADAARRPWTARSTASTP
jgi:hypothetical protein